MRLGGLALSKATWRAIWHLMLADWGRPRRVGRSKAADVACVPLEERPPVFTHNYIRQRQAREATRRARRCPAPARLPTARPAVARAREACPASRREARSPRTDPQSVDTAEPEPRRRAGLGGNNISYIPLALTSSLAVARGKLADRGASTMSRWHGLPLAAPRATGSPVKRYTAFRVLRRALTRCGAARGVPKTRCRGTCRPKPEL